MRTYLLKRVLYSLLVMWGVATLVFFMLRAIPGDPVAVILGEEATPEAMVQLRKNLGLDGPFYVQYARWFARLLRGDLGRSLLAGEQVSVLLWQAAPRTFAIAALALIISLTVAIPAGIISAVKKHTFPDHVATVVAFIGLSMPNFWLGIILILFFSVHLGWFPSMGYVALDEGFWPWLRHLILPAFTTGIAFAAIITRMTRSTMLEVLNETYISTARSKGLLERAVVLKHALRNALIPVITVIGIAFSLLLVGTVVVEDVFAIQGLGRTLVRSIINRDFPVVQGAILLVSGIFVGMNLVVDLLYTYINPKIRFE
ncbi:ABC transporter permease [Candidatus Entotheonella palauensis]|uniref:ABC transporter permease n=1 Tax=Candidatus Entotheonella palauensis TaxID=93172 RepID=UPI000B7D43C6|nr:ABC transporter permease [Candidatus Entotheonella palauensis]